MRALTAFDYVSTISSFPNFTAQVLNLGLLASELTPEEFDNTPNVREYTDFAQLELNKRLTANEFPSKWQFVGDDDTIAEWDLLYPTVGTLRTVFPEIYRQGPWRDAYIVRQLLRYPSKDLPAEASVNDVLQVIPAGVYVQMVALINNHIRNCFLSVMGRS